MSMNRRDFVKFLALTAAGAAALPQQIAAFESYYEANTPQTSEELLAVDEIWASGMASCSTVVKMIFFPEAQSGGMTLGMNAFGGMIRWAAMPDQKIIIRKRHLTWDISGNSNPSILEGHVSYIGQDRRRINQPLIT